MTEPKVYRTDTPATMFAKNFLGTGKTWTLAEQAKDTFLLAVTFSGPDLVTGYPVSRDELADLWEMIGEALHHD